MSVSHLIPHVLEHKQNIDNMLEEVKDWNKDKQQAKCKDHLSWLIESKNSLIYSFVNPNLWPALFLSNHLLQEYLKWIVTIKKKGRGY